MRRNKRWIAAFLLAGACSLLPGQRAEAVENGSIVSDFGDDEEELSLEERILRAVREGEKNVDVLTGNVMEIPSAVQKYMSGNRVTLALHTGDGLAVSLTGTDVRKAEQPFRIVFSEGEVLPEAMRQQVMEGALAGREFGMTEKTAYPFRVNVHLDLGSENAGRPAILYYYDETEEAMKPIGIFRISQSGYAMFALNRGDEYIAVVADGTAYTVTQGDTLGKIAGKSRVKLGRLLSENPLVGNPDRIYPGQIIVIP